MVEEEIRFSTHAISQFSKRVCLSMLDSTLKIRDVWELSQEISREKAFELAGDSAIIKKDNRNTKYYLVDIGKKEVLELIKTEDNHLPLEKMIGIFVIKEGNCVTFKTNLEHNIWSNILKFKKNRRYNDLA